jgi:hypothetical protein
MTTDNKIKEKYAYFGKMLSLLADFEEITPVTPGTGKKCIDVISRGKTTSEMTNMKLLVYARAILESLLNLTHLDKQTRRILIDLLDECNSESTIPISGALEDVANLKDLARKLLLAYEDSTKTNVDIEIGIEDNSLLNHNYLANNDHVKDETRNREEDFSRLVDTNMNQDKDSRMPTDIDKNKIEDSGMLTERDKNSDEDSRIPTHIDKNKNDSKMLADRDKKNEDSRSIDIYKRSDEEFRMLIDISKKRDEEFKQLVEIDKKREAEYRHLIEIDEKSLKGSPISIRREMRNSKSSAISIRREMRNSKSSPLSIRGEIRSSKGSPISIRREMRRLRREMRSAKGITDIEKKRDQEIKRLNEEYSKLTNIDKRRDADFRKLTDIDRKRDEDFRRLKEELKKYISLVLKKDAEIEDLRFRVLRLELFSYSAYLREFLNQLFNEIYSKTQIGVGRDELGKVFAKSSYSAEFFPNVKNLQSVMGCLKDIKETCDKVIHNELEFSSEKFRFQQFCRTAKLFILRKGWFASNMRLIEDSLPIFKKFLPNTVPHGIEDDELIK